jgi:hypothetical protein
MSPQQEVSQAAANTLAAIRDAQRQAQNGAKGQEVSGVSSATQDGWDGASSDERLHREGDGDHKQCDSDRAAQRLLGEAPGRMRAEPGTRQGAGQAGRE